MYMQQMHIASIHVITLYIQEVASAVCIVVVAGAATRRMCGVPTGTTAPQAAGTAT